MWRILVMCDIRTDQVVWIGQLLRQAIQVARGALGAAVWRVGGLAGPFFYRHWPRIRSGEWTTFAKASRGLST